MSWIGFRFLLLFGAVILGGCASTTPFVPAVSYRDFPETGEVTTVTIGSPLISKAKVMAFEGLALSEPLTVTGNIVTSGGRFELMPGEFVAAEADSKWIYYRAVDFENIKFFALGLRSDSFTARGKGATERIPLGRIGVRENKTSGRYEAFHLNGNLLNRIPIPDGVVFERTKVTKIDSPGFKRELLYNGKAGSTIKIIYREFQNDLVRPAFTQELTYDLSESDIIGFQEVRLRILDASNTSITYEMLSGFPDL